MSKLFKLQLRQFVELTARTINYICAELNLIMRNHEIRSFKRVLQNH